MLQGTSCIDRVNYWRKRACDEGWAECPPQGLPPMTECTCCHECANSQSHYDSENSAHASFTQCGEMSQGSGVGANCKSVIDGFVSERAMAADGVMRCQGHCGPILEHGCNTFFWGRYKRWHTLNWGSCPKDRCDEYCANPNRKECFSSDADIEPNMCGCKGRDECVVESKNDMGDGDDDGDADGDVDGNAEGNADGDVDGNADGDSDRDVGGGVDGNPDGNAEGDAAGDVYGDANGDVDGDAYGDADGNADGSTAAIVGGVVGGIIALILIVGGFIAWKKYKEKKENDKNNKGWFRRNKEKKKGKYEKAKKTNEGGRTSTLGLFKKSSTN